VLRFHRCAEFVSTPGEGVLAFDEAGTIRGANRGALKLLGYRTHEALCGQRIETVLDTTLEALMQLAWRHGFRPDSLPPRFGQRRWFASVQAPADALRRASGAGAVAAGVPSIAGLACLPASEMAAAPAVPVHDRRDAPSGDVLASAECDALRRTLEACRWNISATAVRLRLSRRTIYRKMYRHGIARHDTDGASAD
jgi:transcriptional regulator of acetoin/glycerol metabolism